MRRGASGEIERGTHGGQRIAALLALERGLGNAG